MYRNVRSLFLAMWVLFIVHLVFFSPPFHVELLTDLVFRPLSTDPLVLAVFNLLGVWPIIYGALILQDRRNGRISPWPFFIASFFSGAFAVLPYLALERWDRSPSNGSRAARMIGSRWTAAVLFAISSLLLLFGIFLGNPEVYLELFRTDKLVNVMTVDLVILTLAAIPVTYHDMKRRNLLSGSIPMLLAFIPLFGTLAYLLTRKVDNGPER